MRIWDVHPGYLNRQSLLGEHRELHGIVAIILQNKKGYARHPETLRWVGYGWALKTRHRQLASEMALRGYRDQSPVRTRSSVGQWPEEYIDTPAEQFRILRGKYQDKEAGRIRLPRNVQQLWAQHKYSLLARDVRRYGQIGRAVSTGSLEFAQLARELVESLRVQPSRRGIMNACQHMWGHVSIHSEARDVKSWPLGKLLGNTQRLAMQHEEAYLMQSTALSELSIWL